MFNIGSHNLVEKAIFELVKQKIDAISSIKREGYGIIFRLKLEILKHQSASFLN